MSDKTTIVAALIIGGAIITASSQTRTRYALSAPNNNVAWRMDTWSGQIDICEAAYLAAGPLVRCGAVVVTPKRPADTTVPLDPPQPVPQPLAPPASQPRDQASLGVTAPL
jgi:hypothetical protein